MKVKYLGLRRRRRRRKAKEWREDEKMKIR
jgi:hypothetical protein